MHKNGHVKHIIPLKMNTGLILGSPFWGKTIGSGLITDLEKIIITFISDNISDFFTYAAVSKSTNDLIKQFYIYKHLLRIRETCERDNKHICYWHFDEVDGVYLILPNSKPQIVFNWASEYGCLHLVHAMANNQKFDICINDGLMEACRNGHLDVVQFLVNNNRSAAIQVCGGVNLASQNGYLDVVQFW